MRQSWVWFKEDVHDLTKLLRYINQKREFLGVVLVFLIFGVTGYVAIEDWTVFDAIYMIVITMATIGYGEVNPLSVAGRAFTMGLIFFGVIIGSYAISTTIETLTSAEFHQARRNIRKRRQLRRITNHTIICGYGRLGRSLVNELRVHHAPMIVVDLDPSIIESCDRLGVPAMVGNAADERILHEVGIERARSLVAVASTDAENVFIVLSARALNPQLEIIARYNSEASTQKLKRAGADSVISPYVIAGRRITHMLVNPGVTRFLDGVLEIGKQKLRLADFIIHKNSPLAGLTLQAAKLKVTVLAVSLPNQQIISHPTAETRLLPGVEVVVMGLDDELQHLSKLAGGSEK